MGTSKEEPETCKSLPVGLQDDAYAAGFPPLFASSFGVARPPEGPWVFLEEIIFQNETETSEPAGELWLQSIIQVC
jgi:hypothetical protein